MTMMQMQFVRKKEHHVKIGEKLVIGNFGKKETYNSLMIKDLHDVDTTSSDFENREVDNEEDMQNMNVVERYLKQAYILLSSLDKA